MLPGDDLISRRERRRPLDGRKACIQACMVVLVVFFLVWQLRSWGRVAPESNEYYWIAPEPTPLPLWWVFDPSSFYPESMSGLPQSPPRWKNVTADWLESQSILDDLKLPIAAKDARDRPPRNYNDDYLYNDLPYLPLPRLRLFFRRWIAMRGWQPHPESGVAVINININENAPGAGLSSGFASLFTVLDTVPEFWKIMILCYPENCDSWRQGLEDSRHRDTLENGRTEMVLMPMYGHEMAHATYNAMLQTLEFYMFLEGQNIVVFQPDSGFCRGSRHKLTEFIGKYDYVGAPFAHEPDGVGNGGLSLRRRDCFMRLTNGRMAEWAEANEDLWLGQVYRASNQTAFSIPLFEEASHFAVETYFYPDPLGFHRPWQWQFWNYYDWVPIPPGQSYEWVVALENYETLTRNCPEIHEVHRGISPAEIK